MLLDYTKTDENLKQKIYEIKYLVDETSSTRRVSNVVEQN